MALLNIETSLYLLVLFISCSLIFITYTHAVYIAFKISEVIHSLSLIMSFHMGEDPVFLAWPEFSPEVTQCFDFNISAHLNVHIIFIVDRFSFNIHNLLFHLLLLLNQNQLLHNLSPMQQCLLWLQWTLPLPCPHQHTNEQKLA